MRQEGWQTRRTKRKNERRVGKSRVEPRQSTKCGTERVKYRREQRRTATVASIQASNSSILLLVHAPVQDRLHAIAFKVGGGSLLALLVAEKQAVNDDEMRVAEKSSNARVSAEAARRGFYANQWCWIHDATSTHGFKKLVRGSSMFRMSWGFFFFWPWAFMYLRLSDLDERGWASQKKIVKVEYVLVQGERADARVYDHNTTRVGIGSHHGGGTSFLILGRLEWIWADINSKRRSDVMKFRRKLKRWLVSHPALTPWKRLSEIWIPLVNLAWFRCKINTSLIDF